MTDASKNTYLAALDFFETQLPCILDVRALIQWIELGHGDQQCPVGNKGPRHTGTGSLNTWGPFSGRGLLRQSDPGG